MRTTKPIPSVLRMPPLAHWPNQYRPFDVSKSDVVRWLIHQPDVQQWLFDTMRSRQWIAYDAARGLWHGRDT